MKLEIGNLQGAGNEPQTIFVLIASFILALLAFIIPKKM
jgi:hypothetical protein